MRPDRLAFAGLLIASTLLAAPAARGDDRSPYAVRAEALFDEGRRLMTAGDYSAACPKFADSQALDPAPGTVLNLAVCYEHAEKLASAWASFRTAEASAQAAGQKARADLAKKRAEALQPRLSRLTISIPTSALVSGLEVRCDGEMVRPSEWGISLPRDGGKYVIDASATGKKAWVAHVELATAGQNLVVEIPLLQEAPATARVVVVAATPPPPVIPPPIVEGTLPKVSALDDIERSIAVASRVPVRREERGETQRIVGLVIGSAGVLTMGVAGAIGLVARSKFDTATSESGATRHNDSLSAVQTGDAASVVIGAGALVTAIGAGVWLTAPKGNVVVGANGSVLFVKASFR